MVYSAERFIPELGRYFYFKPEHIDVRGGIEQVIPGLVYDEVEFDYDKHVNAKGGAEHYIPHVGKLKFIHPRDVVNKPARTLTKDTTGNTAISVIDITFPDDGHFGSQITEIKRGATVIPKTSYTITAGKISFITNTFPIGTHVVTITATGYKPSTVSQTTT